MFGLSAQDYIDCLMEQYFGGMYERDCWEELTRTAVAQAYREASKYCEIVRDGIVCTTTCAIREFIGADVPEIVRNAHEEAIYKALDKAAREIATGMAKKMLPVAGHVDTVQDAIGTITCSTDCVLPD